MEKTKQRISWIDVTKGIAIYLVILGHSLIGLKVNDYIFAFHMPLFFIASGLLFREKSIKKTITGNIKKLLVPYYITSVCVILGKGSQCVLTGLDGSEYPEFVLKYNDWCSFWIWCRWK